MGGFTKIPAERAEQIRRMLEQAGQDGQGLVFDRDDGQLVATGLVRDLPDDKVNAISHFGSHFHGQP